MSLLIDLLLVLCLLLTMIAGARGGFFRELFSLMGVIGGVWLATRFSPEVMVRLPAWCRGSTICSIVIFVLVFLVAYAVLRLVGTAFAALWEGKEPAGPSRLAGLILGLARGVILILVLAGAIVLLSPAGSSTLGRSRVLPRLSPGIRVAAQLLPEGLRSRLLLRWEELPFPGRTKESRIHVSLIRGAEGSRSPRVPGDRSASAAFPAARRAMDPGGQETWRSTF